VETQFRYSKFVSQQWKLANDYVNCILEPRGVWICVSLQCTCNSGKSITFLYVDQSSSRRLEKIGEDIPTCPEDIGAYTLNFRPKFKFSRLKFLGGHPSLLCCALAKLGQSLTRVKIWGDSTAYGPNCSLPKYVHLGGLGMSPYNFFVCGPKFT